MQFVKTEDLKAGMRLGRPIYNKNGVLLFERDYKFTQQSIENIKNFGLIGVFVLEPAEPVSPMTEEDIEFERFQAMTVFAIQEEMNNILQKKRPSSKTESIVSSIIKKYGHKDKRINFIQSLRSREDFTYKHGLNVGILCAMITNRMNLSPGERQEIVTAGVLYTIGRLTVPSLIWAKEELSDEDLMEIEAAEVAGFKVIEDAFSSTPNLRRICSQTNRIMQMLSMGEPIGDIKLVTGAKILMVAETFDDMTAIQFHKQPVSEVAALKHFMNHPQYFDPAVVKALTDSVNILTQGVSVELNTGEKGLVLAANERNILRPMILLFNDNTTVDLSDERLYGDLEIVDVMKTMDNRYTMNVD